MSVPEVLETMQASLEYLPTANRMHRTALSYWLTYLRQDPGKPLPISRQMRHYARRYSDVYLTPEVLEHWAATLEASV